MEDLCAGVTSPAVSRCGRPRALVSEGRGRASSPVGKSLAAFHPHLVREWDAAANSPLRPDRMKATYDMAVGWICRDDASHPPCKMHPRRGRRGRLAVRSDRSAGHGRSIRLECRSRHDAARRRGQMRARCGDEGRSAKAVKPNRMRSNSRRGSSHVRGSRHRPRMARALRPSALPTDSRRQPGGVGLVVTVGRLMSVPPGGIPQPPVTRSPSRATTRPDGSITFSPGSKRAR